MKLTPKNTNDSIKKLTADLVGKQICDDTNWSFIRNHGETIEVTFNNWNYISCSLKDIPYVDVYQELKSKRSFNMKFIDGAILQMMYIFKGDYLSRHRLAFYPSPDLPSFQEEPEGYMEDELFIDIVRRRIIPFPLRFDFDAREGVHEGIIHPQSHLTLGEIKNCRIPVSAPVTPYWFMAFILHNFYQTKKYNFVSGLPGDKIEALPSITEKEKNIIHVIIPY